jgi:2-polyprenyl-3-methyl-5-hydroxy-6-metoxy-1,4-benzoquinol methylase
MTYSTPAEAEYVLARTTAEHDRLTRQSRLVSKITQHFLERTEIGPGMRALDIGSGVGDVALLVSRMVGPDGAVVCVDTDAAALAVARQRAQQRACNNISFCTGNFHTYENSGVRFDAIVGRCVLLHQQAPIAALEAAIRHLRPGGIVAFQEPWFSRGFCYPAAPLFQEMIGWLHATVAASGLDGDIGLRLPSIFLSAGLPRPQLTFEMLVDCNPESELYEFCVETVQSLLPRMTELGVTTAAHVRVDTLAERLRKEAATLNSVIGVMPLMGAWCNKV